MVRVSELLEIPVVVAATDLLGYFLLSMAPLMEKHLGLRMLEMPLELPSVPIYMIWHEMRRKEAAHRWLRELVVTEISRFASGQVSTDVSHALERRGLRGIINGATT